EKFATQESDFADLYSRLVDLCRQKKDWTSVTNYADRMLSINPLSPVPHRGLAEAGVALGNNEMAITAYRKLLSLDPPDPSETHYQLAKLLHARGNDEAEAKRNVLEALEEAPRFRGGGGGFGGGWGGGSWGESYVPPDAKTAREVESHSTGTPMWTNAPGFDKDVFTFVRIRRNRKWGTGGSWQTDTPDSDLNLSFRLQQVTSIKVDPNGRYLWLTDPELFRYPFIYMVEPGTLSLDDEEVAALRKYLLNGGFLWVDDFWGEAEWEGMAEELRKVFPDR